MNQIENIIFFDKVAYKKLKHYLLNNIDTINNVFILLDNYTKIHCLPILYDKIDFLKKSNIIEIKSGEKKKNIYTCIEIFKKLEELKGNRKSLILNLGGGVVTDIGGFVASIFKRGIRFINIPTTLLGMVDASIGYKNGVNLNYIKNVIGSFNVPDMLIIDTNFLKTLSKYEIFSGIAEMFKHGLIADKNYWNEMKNKYLYIQNDNVEIANYLIYKSIIIKQKIVNKDPKENGLRKILNFGHTIGHALESYLMNKKKISHGIAIALGMIYESWISLEKNGLSKKDYNEIKFFLSDLYSINKIFSNSEIEIIYSIIKYDKKNENNNIYFSLLNKIGVCSYNCEVSFNIIKNSLLHRF